MGIFSSFQKKADSAKSVSSICIDPDKVKFGFNIDDVKKAAADYSAEELNSMAAGMKAVGRLILDNFDCSQVVFMAPATLLDPNVKSTALPVHFLFTKDGHPILAVVLVTANGFRIPMVNYTRWACEHAGVEYHRVFVTGMYADWITGVRADRSATTPEQVEYVKQLLVDKIKKAIQ